jgi:hypothetical protein
MLARVVARRFSLSRTLFSILFLYRVISMVIWRSRKTNDLEMNPNGSVKLALRWSIHR